MPTRGVLPTISITWTTTSSPTMTFSPARRVMISMAVPPWIRVAGGNVWAVVLCGLGGHVGEQRDAHLVRHLVDHLMATAVRDHYRRVEVRTEVRKLRTGADDDVDLGRLGPDASEVGVGELDGVVGEEGERVGDRQRERRLVDGVQPAEGRLGVGRDDGVAAAAESDQAGRELDHGVGRDLQRAEARGLDGKGGHGSPGGGWRGVASGGSP